MLSAKQEKSIAKITNRFGLFGHLLSQMELNELRNILSKAEEVEAMIYGYHNGTFALMVATNEVLHFIDKRLFDSRIEDFDYFNIETIEYDQSVMWGMIKMTAANNTIELKYAPKHLLYHFASVVEYKMQRSRKRSASKSTIDSEINTLERLAQMRHKGDLTETEFQLEKAKIINKL